MKRGIYFALMKAAYRMQKPRMFYKFRDLYRREASLA